MKTIKQYPATKRFINANKEANEGKYPMIHAILVLAAILIGYGLVGLIEANF